MMPSSSLHLGASFCGSAHKNIWEQFLQQIVALELLLDLPQEGLRDRPGVAEDAECEVRIVQNVLDRQREGDDARLVVVASPQIEKAVGFLLNLTTAGEAPGVVGIRPGQAVNEKEEQVSSAKVAKPIRPLLSRAALEARHQQTIV